MEEEFNTLIGKYGIVAIHSYLENRMKQDYNYLKKIFEKKLVESKVKKVIENPVVDEVVDEVIEPMIEQRNEKSFKDPKEMKKWQKEMEDIKRKEQEAKGIDPTSLLTKENLQKWYGEEGRTFSYIAREYIGCRDTEVSNAVKMFNIVNTRKNIIIRGLMQKKKNK